MYHDTSQPSKIQAIIYDLRFHNERKTVKGLRSQMANLQEMNPGPAATVEENVYDYVYDVPDVTDDRPPAPRGGDRAPTRRQSTIR